MSVSEDVKQFIDHFEKMSGCKNEPLIVIVGPDVSSETLIALRQAGVKVVNSLLDPRVQPVGFAVNAKGKGPRDQWGIK
jgi:hypothetical protein